jgi:hypothetical protein
MLMFGIVPGVFSAPASERRTYAPSGIRTRLQMDIFLAACTHRCTHAASTGDTNERE